MEDAGAKTSVPYMPQKNGTRLMSIQVQRPFFSHDEVSSSGQTSGCPGCRSWYLDPPGAELSKAGQA